MDINIYNSAKAAIGSDSSTGIIRTGFFLNHFSRFSLAIFIAILVVSCDRTHGDTSTRGVGVDEETSSPAEFGNYHALVIGINDYEKWPNLKFAEKDADDIQKILISQYAFPKKNVTYLKNKEATREGILKALRLKLEGLG